MQMVRDFLSEAKAPFHIQSHFENLVSEYAKEAGRAEELEEQVDSLEQNESDEIGKLQDRVEELEDKLDDICGDGMRGALETVKYWLLDVLVHGRPMQKPPRQILRIVEDAL
jgi:hypothetical protein